MGTLAPASLLVASPAGLVFSLPYQLQHIPGLSAVTDRVINSLGKMLPNKYFAIAFLGLFGLLGWTYFLQSFEEHVPWWRNTTHDSQDRWSPRFLIMLSVCAMLMMLTMGWARETARAYNGYLIYGQIRLDDERSTYEGSAASKKPRMQQRVGH